MFYQVKDFVQPDSQFINDQINFNQISKNNKRVIHDPIYDVCGFPDSIWKIIDTDEFQRLRNIKKLETVHFVENGANYTVFEHSLGVAYLSLKYFKIIVKNYNKNYENMGFQFGEKNSEQLKRLKNLVTIAGLCYNLGSLPFQCVLEKPFPTWNLEKQSCEILKQIMNNLKNSSSINDKEREKKQFIPSLIKDFDIIENMMKGLSIEDWKQNQKINKYPYWVFQIVKNHQIPFLDAVTLDFINRTQWSLYGSKSNINFKYIAKGTDLKNDIENNIICLNYGQEAAYEITRLQELERHISNEIIYNKPVQNLQEKKLVEVKDFNISKIYPSSQQDELKKQQNISQKNMEKQCKTIIASGRPGVGKSYLGNFLLINDPKSQTFISESNPGDFGVTKEIQINNVKDFNISKIYLSSQQDELKKQQNISQKNMEGQCRTILASGRPGVGKSYLGNFLLNNDPNSQTFLSESNPSDFGVTKVIQVSNAYAKHFNCDIEFIDIPGSGDPTISITEIANELVTQVSKKTINAALMLIDAYDERASLAEVLTVSFLKNFFKTTGIDTKDILWVVFTRCQEKKPDPKFIKKKLDFLMKIGLEVSMNHVVEFDSTVESLQPFIKQVFKINQDQGLKVETDVEQVLQNFSKDLRDVSVKDPYIRKEIEQFEMITRMMETNDQLSSYLNTQADALKDIVSHVKSDINVVMAANERLVNQLELQHNTIKEMTARENNQIELIRNSKQKLVEQLDKQSVAIPKLADRSCSIF